MSDGWFACNSKRDPRGGSNSWNFFSRTSSLSRNQFFPCISLNFSILLVMKNRMLTEYESKMLRKCRSNYKVSRFFYIKSGLASYHRPSAQLRLTRSALVFYCANVCNRDVPRYRDSVPRPSIRRICEYAITFRQFRSHSIHIHRSEIVFVFEQIDNRVVQNFNISTIT